MKVDCIRLVRDALAELDPLDPSVEELGRIVERLGYVKAGDIIEPEHHNLVVDALKVVHEILRARLQPLQGLTVAYDVSLGYSVPVVIAVHPGVPLYGANLLSVELAATSPLSAMGAYYLTTYS